MNTALLPERGVIKVAGDGARNFLHGLVTADVLNLTAGEAKFCALLTPQGKIIADFIVAEAPKKDGGGFFLDVPQAQAAALIGKLNLYRLRAKVIVEDLSQVLGVLAAWNGASARCSALMGVGLCYADPRLPALGLRVMLPPHLAGTAADKLDATLVDAGEYEAHRIALGVPRGGVDFSFGDAFPHEAEMDQLGGVDFAKGCYVGQEVVSRMEHRGTARTRAVPVSFAGAAPAAGTAVVAGDRQLGSLGSAAAGKAIALLRLDRVADALAQGEPLMAGTTPIRLVKPDWARFAFPGERKAAE
ncbi:MAG TPA: folate-binding protein [Xanthobacteraceae bacterium]|nr:folate-binding protein [Xanthobacteraceae bacterium]